MKIFKQWNIDRFVVENHLTVYYYLPCLLQSKKEQKHALNSESALLGRYPLGVFLVTFILST